MRTRKEPEVRRKEILAAVHECFLQAGYEGTTASDIARAAGVAKGTFFYYFPTKESALRSIAEQEARAICAHARRESTGRGAVEELRTLLRLFGEPIEMDDLLDRLTALEEDRAIRLLWEGARPVLDVYVKDILAHGRAEGTMSVRDSEIAISFFWSILEAIWDIRAIDTSEERMQLRQALGYRLIEELLGMKKGSLGI